MSKARLVITAVTVEKRPVSEVAKAYGVARSWIYALLARYQAEGEAAFEPRSRRPKTSPTAISDDAADLIIRLRKELSGQGLDAGPQTIAWHLHHHHQVKVSAAYAVTGQLASAAARLGQLTGQIGQFLARELAAGRLGDDAGADPATGAARADDYLANAAAAGDALVLPVIQYEHRTSPAMDMGHLNRPARNLAMASTVTRRCSS
jgi:hypothetical protein